MSLGEHFQEFRRRVYISLAAMFLCAIWGWFLYDPILEMMQEPLRAAVQVMSAQGTDIKLNFGNATGPFTVHLTVALWAGFIISGPVWLGQIWRFLVPGLTKRERSLSRRFILAAIILFFLGCYLATRSIRTAMSFLLSETPANAANYLNTSDYITFYMRFVVAFGIAFLLPVFLIGLNTAGVMSGRTMLKGWRPAVLIIFVFSAALTPSPDAWTMLALAFPMCGLFYGAVGLAMFMDRLRARKEKDEYSWLSTQVGEASSIDNPAENALSDGSQPQEGPSAENPTA